MDFFTPDSRDTDLLSGAASRPQLNARALIAERIAEHQASAKALQVLLDTLPARLTPEADRALVHLLLD